MADWRWVTILHGDGEEMSQGKAGRETGPPWEAAVVIRLRVRLRRERSGDPT